MKRSLAVTIAATLSLLGSLGWLLLSLLALAGGLLANSAVPKQQAGGTMLALASLPLVALAGLGIATSIGLFRLKRWARLSILFFAGVLAVYGLITSITFLVVTIPAPPTQDPNIVLLVRTVMSTLGGALAALGSWWLWLFNRAPVKEQFGVDLSPAKSGSRPLSITLIAWLLLLSALGGLFNVAFRFPAAVFGYMFGGLPAVVWSLAMGGVALYLGIGLLRLDPRARRLAIGYLVFGLVNAALFYFLPGASERIAMTMKALPASYQPRANQPLPMVGPWVMAAGAAASVGFQLYFLVVRRAAFEKAPVGEPTSSSGA